jgi:hypothetical protein
VLQGKSFRTAYLYTIRQIHRRKHQNSILAKVYLQPPALRSNLEKKIKIVIDIGQKRNTLFA